MTKREGDRLKKPVLILLAIAVAFVLFSGCGEAGNEVPPETAAPSPSAVQDAGVQADGPEQTEPAQPAEPDNPAPEDSGPVPADLLGDELNIFSDVAFPAGYDVYAADFENNGYYKLYLTAAGDPEEIVAFMSNLVGDSAEESIRQNIDYYNNDGGVGINGRLDGDGLQVDCFIEAAVEGDYDYDYVEGCTIRLRAPVADPSVYMKIIEDNYNLNALSEAAGFFDVAIVTGKTNIYVRKNRNNAQIVAVYSPIDDVAGVMESMKAAMNYKGFDENSNIMNLEDYGDVGVDILFDFENNSICVFQGLADSGKNYKDYELAANKLTELGFRNAIESDALCEFKDNENDVYISVNVPQWGSRPEEFENSCVTFLKSINGYLLVIWYYPDEQSYTIQADKDDTSAKVKYSDKTGEFTDEWSNQDTVREQFVNMFGDAAEDDVYMQCVEIFKSYVQDAFGMSIDELYALAASE